MKKYYVPATEVVALAGTGMLMASPVTPALDPNDPTNQIDPGSSQA